VLVLVVGIGGWGGRSGALRGGVVVLRV